MGTSPSDYLKIDGQFVDGATEDPTDQLVIGALSRLACGLGQQTIAEHVEDAATPALLRSHRIDHAQGDHLGAPAPAAQTLGRTDCP